MSNEELRQAQAELEAYGAEVDANRVIMSLEGVLGLFKGWRGFTRAPVKEAAGMVERSFDEHGDSPLVSDVVDVSDILPEIIGGFAKSLDALATEVGAIQVQKDDVQAILRAINAVFADLVRETRALNKRLDALERRRAPGVGRSRN